MRQSADGGIVAAGDLYVPDVDDHSQVLKLQASGEVAWRYAIAAQQQSRVRITGLLATSDGGGLISIRITQPDAGGSSGSADAVLRLGADGTLLWEREYAGNPFHQTPDGGFLLVGPQSELRKIDAGGETVWVRSIELTTPNGAAWPRFARELPDGSLLIGGYELTLARVRPRESDRASGDYPTWMWFARISPADEVLWKRYFEFRGFSGAVPTGDGGFAIAGENYVDDTDYGWLLKLSAEGEIEHWKRYREISFVHRVLGTPDGGFVLIGVGPVPQADFALADRRVLKVDSSGFAEWGLNFGTMTDPGYAAALQDGSTVLLFPRGWFYRFSPEGHLPGCEATLNERMQVRTTDVIPPPDRSELLDGPLISAGARPSETDGPDQPLFRLSPLGWEVREVCRHFP